MVRIKAAVMVGRICPEKPMVARNGMESDWRIIIARTCPFFLTSHGPINPPAAI